MVKLDLQPNEGIVLEREHVHRNGPKSGTNGDLVLTNLNLYFASKKGTFRTTTDVIKFPLNQIKVVNNQAQALIAGNKTTPVLQILFNNDQEEFTFLEATFGFQTKKEMLNWIENICGLIGADVSEAASNVANSAIPGTKEIAGALKNTVGTFKETVGIKAKGEDPVKNVTCKCIGCMAPLSGTKGQKVKCKYCDTEQILK